MRVYGFDYQSPKQRSDLTTMRSIKRFVLLALSCSGASIIYLHGRSIYTEEKSKVVAAAWEIDLIEILTALAILNYSRTILNNRMNSSFSSNHPGEIHPILQFVLVQN